MGATTVCEIVETKFRDDDGPKTIGPDGQERTATYKAFQAVIRNGRSLLCNVTPKRLETLEDIGVDRAFMVVIREQCAKAEKMTAAANPGRVFDAPKASARGLEVVSLASIRAAAKGKK